MATGKIKSKEVILEAQRDKQKVHFATLMDTELGPTLQKCGGRLVLRGDMVKDDSGAYAVFTEQGSSASQVTAAEVVDVVARLPDCDGQAADAVSACTEAKLDDAPRLLNIPKSECPDEWTRLPRPKWPKILVKHWRSRGTSRTKVTSTSIGRTGMGKTLWRSFTGTCMGKSTKLGMSVCSSNEIQDYSSRYTWMI